MQASHRLEGPFYLRRNFNHRFMVLEHGWANAARHACTGMMIDKLVGGFSRPYNSTAAQDGLTEGNIMSLSEVMAKEVRALNLGGSDRQLGRVCICI